MSPVIAAPLLMSSKHHFLPPPSNSAGANDEPDYQAQLNRAAASHHRLSGLFRVERLPAPQADEDATEPAAPDALTDETEAPAVSVQQ